MDRTAFEVHDELDALRHRLYRTGQEGEQATAAAMAARAGVRRFGRGTSRMEAVLAAVREEADRMRNLLRFGLTALAPAWLASVHVMQPPMRQSSMQQFPDALASAGPLQG